MPTPTYHRRVVASYASADRMYARLAELRRENLGNNIGEWYESRFNDSNYSRPHQIIRVIIERREEAMPANVTPPPPPEPLQEWEVDLLEAADPFDYFDGNGDGDWVSPLRNVPGVRNVRLAEVNESLRLARAQSANETVVDWLTRFGQPEQPMPVRLVPPTVTEPTASTGLIPCDSCQRYRGFDDINTIRYSSSPRTDRNICTACLHRDYAQCYDCDNYTRTFNITITNSGNDVCPSCRDNNYTECSECERWVAQDESCECDSEREPWDEDGDHCTCDACSSSRNTLNSNRRRSSPALRRHHQGTINNYSYRPTPRFKGDGKLFFGMEIEVTTPYERGAGRYQAAGAVEESFGDLVYVKEDGSISTGIEIVTHPMSYEWAMSEFPWDKWAYLKSLGIDADDSTGIHIHVSRAGFSGASHTYRWLQFFYRNADMVKRIARREDGNYSRFDNGQRRIHMDAAKGKPKPCRQCWGCRNLYACEAYRPERYSAINLQNTDTFEVRVFASTVCADQIKAALGLVSASVEYTRSINSHNVIKDNAWEWAPFVAWVCEHPQYTPLTKEIERLCAC